MDNLIEQAFNNVVIEAEDGITYNKNILIKFHTLEKYSINSCYNDGIPVLVIRNKKELLNKVIIYVKLVLEKKKLDYNSENIKKCIYLLFANCCYEDFSNPTKFVDNHINFYLNDEFMDEDKKIDNIIIKRSTQTIYKETPYAFKAIIEEDNNKYYLPNVNYGISNDICYIYSLEQTTKNKVNDYSKLIEEKYSVNLLALTLLIKELCKYGISKIKVVSFLPMRYGTEQKNEVQMLLEDFNYLNYLFNNIRITSNPFEQDEYMNLEIKEFDGESKSNLQSLLFEEECKKVA